MNWLKKLWNKWFGKSNHDDMVDSYTHKHVVIKNCVAGGDIAGGDITYHTHVGTSKSDRIAAQTKVVEKEYKGYQSTAKPFVSKAAPTVDHGSDFLRDVLILQALTDDYSQGGRSTGSEREGVATTYREPDTTVYVPPTQTYTPEPAARETTVSDWGGSSGSSSYDAGSYDSGSSSSSWD